MEANFMNCSRSRNHLLRFASLGFAGALIAAGCGGSTTVKKDGGPDGGDGGTQAVFKLMPTANDFASVEINKMSAPFNFMLANTGGGVSGQPTITVSNGDFAATGCTTALNPAASCMIAVVFKPTSIGSKSAVLTVTAANGGTQTANLSGSGVMAGLSITPSQHDYGAVAVGVMSDVFTFTVANTGGVALSALNVSVTGADFSASATGNKCATTMALASGANCTIEVVFKPGARGVKQGTLTASAGGQTVMASLTGTGQTPPSFAISPAAPMFAGIVGTPTAAMPITIANIGDAPTGQVTVALAGANADQFKLTSNCVAPLPGAGSCTATVTFLATSAGMKTATLTVSSPVGGMTMATLTGTADAAPSLSIDPTSNDFGTVAMGKSSASKAFTITNKGGAATAALTVNASTTEFGITANTCTGQALAPNATCTVSVFFTPASLGAKTAILSVAGMGSEVARATLSGVGAGIGLTATPTALIFASTATGQTTMAQTVAITNTGGTTTGTLIATLAGASASQFAIGGNSCTATLAPPGPAR